MTHIARNTGPSAQAQSTNAQERLGALIAARICHDLISPMGAISNGLELLQLAQNTEGPEIALIAQSITQANTRLRLYRIAFGTSGAGQAIKPAEIQSILKLLDGQGRLRYDWRITRIQDRLEASLLLLLVLCLESTLPWGGTILVQDSDSGEIELEARSERLKFEENLWQMVETGTITPDLVAARVHFALAGQALAAQGLRLSPVRSDTALHLRLTQMPSAISKA